MPIANKTDAAARQNFNLRLASIRLRKELYPFPARLSKSNVKLLIALFRFFALKLLHEGLT